MISHLSLIVFSLVLLTVTINVQSIPINPMQDVVRPSVSAKISLSSVVTGEKKKRDIDDYDQIADQSDEDHEDDVLAFTEKNKHVLHAQVKETTAQNHTAIEEPIDIDNAQLFTDVKMFPNELMQLGRRRRRRQLTLDDKFPQRRKRALSPFNFYDTDPFYQPYIPNDDYFRESRDLGPVYWYPLLNQRILRSAWDDTDDEDINPWINEDLEDSYNHYPSRLDSPIEYWPTVEDDDDDDVPMAYESDDESYLL